MDQYFNPRSREGSDAVTLIDPDDNEISIHAPVKGATRRYICRFSCRRYFNPRSREGSDMRSPRSTTIPTRFQSTLP